LGGTGTEHYIRLANSSSDDALVSMARHKNASIAWRLSKFHDPLIQIADRFRYDQLT
jgi:hypothetical protein